ncbi:LysM peptidoglycan-binding domain-containing protein [Prosthecobacter vanneervenii]|uniref:LysM repeat protein n=1 Tax=Prosthecobacter vanneervenii TaxID=48466 RepID=A0A7W7YCJ5_9BACT|nr:LysM peptidoglycan-binding domain-containing protein [Prosthecobacter vanneervenii]MBB5033673.1 LysM repeat protein [Prosthecobacter vanneervenii]
MTALRFIALSLTCLALASCENMKKSGSSDPYASNYNSDGHYNPYPSQGGRSTPSYQTPPASTLPADPEPPNPYAFGSSKKSPPASSGSTKSSSSKKTVASSSSAKKKTTPTKSGTKKSSGSRYTVAKGDTLSAIARKKGTSVAKIKAANGMSGDLIRPGQALKIP